MTWEVKKMRKTKKILAGILAAVLVTGLAGCGGIITRKNRKFGQDKSFDGYFWWGRTGYI